MPLKNKAIIWDLLGTLGGDSKTLIHEQFDFFDEAIPALKKATAEGFLNIIITNQSHIAHGRISSGEYERALNKLLAFLDEKGAEITEVYTCPHARKDNCDCKKPQSTLADQAISTYNLDRTQSFVVGDSGKNDMLLAKNAKMKSVLVLTGGGIDSLTNERHLWQVTQPTHIAEDSLDAVNKIIKYH